MANDDRRVDLVVRAKDVEAKPLADLLKLIDQLGKGLDALAKDGGPATRTIAELTSTVKDFKTVADELASRRALVESFIKISNGAVEAADRLDKAKTALDSYKVGLEGVEKVSKDQTAALKVLQREYNNAEKQSKGFTARQTSAVESLASIGVAAADAAQELQKLAAVEESLDNLSLRAEQNARGRDQAVRDLKAQTKATQDAAAAAALLRAEEGRRAAASAVFEQAMRIRPDVGVGGSPANLEASNALMAEAVRLQKERVAEEIRLERVEHSRLANIERRGREELLAEGKRDLAGELLNLKDAAALESRIAAERKATRIATEETTAAEAKRHSELLAFEKAREAQLAKIAAQNQRSADAARAAITARLTQERADEKALAIRKEQIQADQLFAAEAAGRAEQLRKGQQALQAELLTQKELAEADAKRMAFAKAIGAQKEAAVAGQREEVTQLQKAGTAAKATLSEIERLVAAMGQLRATPAVQSLAQQIGELANPAKQAAFSLDALSNALPEIERRQRQAANSIGQNAAETKQLAQDYRTLEQALASLNRVAGATDSFRKQRDELSGVEAALAQARAELEHYSLVARHGLGGQGTLDSIAQQQKLIEQLRREFERLSPRVAESEQLLRTMGIAADKLEASERELLATTGRVRVAFDQAGDATTRLGAATQKGAGQLGGYHNESRTALTLYQRVRGQVLSLTAAYVGLFGVIQEGRRTVEATTALQGINARLGVAFGDDPAVVGKELDYVRKQSDRLGLSLKDAAAGYSNFAIAGKSANLTGNESRFIFEKFSEVSRVMNLSVDDTNGVFKALGQILSKSKVQAEELRGQLGDRLSGAFTQFANSLGISAAALDKLLESGKVPADFLLLFAKQFGETVKNQVTPASKSFASEMARLDTALFDFRNTVAEGGFLDTLTKLTVQLTAFLKSAEGAQTAQVLSDLFVIAGDAGIVLLGVVKGVVQGVRSLMDTASGLKEAFLGLFDGVALPGFIKNLLDAVDAAKALGVALVYLGVAGGINLLLTRLTAVIAAFAGSASAATLAVRLLATTIKAFLWPVLVLLVGVDVFRWAESNFSWVAKVSIVLEGLFQKLEAIAKFLATPAGPIGFAKAFDELKKKLAEIDAVQEKGFAKIVAKEEGITTITRPDASGRAVIHDPKIKGAGARGTAGNGVNDATILDAERENALREQAKKLAAGTPNKEAIAQAKKDLAEAMALVKSVESATASLEVSAAKKSADDATEAARAIDLQYAGLIENIHKLGTVSESELKKIREGAAKAGFNVSEAANVAELQKTLLARVEAAKATLKQEAADKLAAKQAKEKVDALLAERDALIELEKVKAEIDPALKAQAQENELRILGEYRDRIVEAALAAAILADNEKKVAEAAKLRSIAVKAGARGTDQDVERAKLNDKQKDIQQQTGERDAKLALVDAQLSTRTIDDVQAQEQRLAIMEQYSVKISEAAVAARDLAASLGDTTMVANMDALLLRLTQTDEQAIKIAETFKTQFADALVNAAMKGAEALAQIVVKGGDINDVFDAIGKTFADFAQQFLQQVAGMIIQTYALAAAQAILTAVGGPSLAGAGGGAGTVSGGAGFVARHRGGTVGAWGMTRQVSADVFEGAQRFHAGGLPGLRPDEVPTILQKGEQVLAKNDPNNILNGGGKDAAAQALRMVVVDDPNRIEEAMTGIRGERAVIAHVKRNASSIRQILKGS